MEYIKHGFKAGDVLKADQLNRLEDAVGLAMQTALPVTLNIIKRESAVIDIVLMGLRSKEQYTIQLFRKSRSSHTYEPMFDDTSGEERWGWSLLAGKPYRCDSGSVVHSYFTTDIPSWMPNSGILQSRWVMTTKAGKVGTRASLQIDLSTWLLDGLKPIENNWEGNIHALIGLNKHRDNCLKFKVGVFDKEGQLVAFSNNAIYVSGVKGNGVEKHSQAYLDPAEPSAGIKNLCVRLT